MCKHEVLYQAWRADKKKNHAKLNSTERKFPVCGAYIS